MKHRRSVVARVRIAAIAVFGVVLCGLLGCTSTRAELERPISESDVIIEGLGGLRTNFHVDVMGYGAREIDRLAAVVFGSSPIKMSAGECELSVIVSAPGGKGMLSQWQIVLAGGRAYIVRGKQCDDAAEIWIEEKATGTRVSEIVSIALFDDR